MNCLQLIDEFYKDRRSNDKVYKLGVMEKLAIREAFEWVVENYDMRRMYGVTKERL